MKLLLALFLAVVSCSAIASPIIMTFDDLAAGSYPENPYHLDFSSQFVVADHSNSCWGPPNSGANVLVNSWGGSFDSAMIKFWYWDAEQNEIHPTLKSFGAYFSTEWGTVLNIVAYCRSGEVLRTTVGEIGTSWQNRWAEVSSAAGDIEMILLEPVTCNALFCYCLDDLTVEFYEEAPPKGFTENSSELAGLLGSNVAWGDYDNDGDLDFVACGKLDRWGPYQSTVYRNDDGLFTDSGTEVPGLEEASAAWGDYDGDGDLDLAVCGSGSGYEYGSTIIYRNDSGVLTDSGLLLDGDCPSSPVWGDFDNDGDQDLVTGCKLFRNDRGTFRDMEMQFALCRGKSTAWGDYDNDGDLDLVVASYRSKIYRNDSGKLVDSGIALPSIDYGGVDWGDYDSDGDLDLVIAGAQEWGSPNERPICAIYRNDDGSFVDIGAQIPGVSYSSVAWGDSDNDGDLDLAVAGMIDPNSVPVTAIYTNEDGAFVDAEASLPGVMYCSIAWGDYDGDGDLDLLMSGDRKPWVAQEYSYPSCVTKVYRNDAVTANNPPAAPTGLTSTLTPNGLVLSWEAAEDDHTPASGLSYNLRVGTSPGACDVFSGVSDDSGLRRVPCIGNAQKRLSWTITELKSPGSYYWSVQAIDAGFVGSAWAAEQRAEVSLVKITGCARGSSGQGIAGVLLHADNGGGMTETGSDGCYELWVPRGWSGSVALSKRNHWFTPVSRGYTDVTAGVVDQDYLVGAFTDTGASLGGVWDEVDLASWADYDNDGDLDLLVAGCTGFTTQWNYTTKLFRNDGGAFVDSGVTLPCSHISVAKWGDYDNDGDLDLAIVGQTESASVTKIFRNDGLGVFTDVMAALGGGTVRRLAWGDYDNDGDLDLVVNGTDYSYPSGYLFKVYRNNKGVFSDSGMSLPDLWCTALGWADYDNDGDLDLSATGVTASEYTTNYLGMVLRNDAGSLVRSGVYLPGVQWGALDWGDYDNDGDLDLVIGGWNMWDWDDARLAGIFRNDSGALVDSGAQLIPLAEPDYAWGDFDNDGDLDLSVVGYGSDPYVGRIYRNDAGSFVDFGVRLDGAWNLEWADYDNDGDLDFAVTQRAACRIYRNDGGIFNTPPSAPSGLAASFGSDSSLTLSWSAALDKETPSPGLSYSVRVGTRPGLCDVFSGSADPDTGFRKLPALGNAQKRLSWTLKGVPIGQYYWGVQAIDTAFAGSAWATGDCYTEIGRAKALQDTAQIGASGIVTAVFADAFYVENPSRTSGIRVEMSDHGARVGDQVEVWGSMGTTPGAERLLRARTLNIAGGGARIEPYFMDISALGGGQLGQQVGVEKWQGTLDERTGAVRWQSATGGGANNVGLLVKVTGRVARLGDKCFELGYTYPSDGSGEDHYYWVRVDWPFADPMPQERDFVEVTAISSCMLDAGRVVSVLRPVTAASVREIDGN